MSKRGRYAGGASRQREQQVQTVGGGRVPGVCLARVRSREGGCAASMEEQERGRQRWWWGLSRVGEVVVLHPAWLQMRIPWGALKHADAQASPTVFLL